MQRPLITMEGEYYVPPGTPPDTYRYVVPDNVVERTFREFLPQVDQMVGIDPFGGTGTFSRIAHKLGGLCHYLECDPEQYENGSKQVPNPEFKNFMFLGDSLKEPPIPYGAANYIYTSFPFGWLYDKRPGPGHGMRGIGFLFHTMLRKGGLVIIDSAIEAERDGAIINPAAATIKYFDLCGFRLLDRLDFYITNAPAGCDRQFTELAFGASWEYGPSMKIL